jgi:16S rRNA (guanine527-N7)-methyltransferase
MGNDMDCGRLLADAAKEFGVEPDKAQIGQFLAYKELLKEWNEKINLTAIEDDREVILKHFADSLSVVPILEKLLLPGKKATVIDIGTGAGFPGIPLRIVLDNIHVTLADSLEKRVKFLDEAIRVLKLNHIKAVHGRAEDLGNRKEYREIFDVSIARAVASLPVLLEYCLPFVNVGGIFLAMKGGSTEEIAASKKALEVLGGRIEEVIEFTLPFTDMKRNIIVVRKFRPTPTKYPRKAGKPTKEPLI